MTFPRKRSKTLIAAGLSLSLACAAGCVTMDAGSLKESAKGSACEMSCDKTKDQCIEKCKNDSNKAACELGCAQARDKCVKECKKQ